MFSSTDNKSNEPTNQQMHCGLVFSFSFHFHYQFNDGCQDVALLPKATFGNTFLIAMMIFSTLP